MFKTLASSVAVLALIATASTAFAGHGRCDGYYAPAPVAAPAPAVAPQASAPQGYRAFSYQPSEPANRSFSRGSRSTGRAYENAINKSVGRGF